VSDPAPHWPAEAGENPFGAERRPSPVRRVLARLFRRRENDPPRAMRVKGYLVGTAAGLGFAVLTHTDHWLMVTLGAFAGEIAVLIVWRRSLAQRSAADERG